MEIVLMLLIPLGMAVFGLALLANAVESISKSVDEYKRMKK
jgi:hypothetical protein